MYQKSSPAQPEFPNFYMPFNGRLDPSNRWIQMARLVPWDELEERYSELFSDHEGRPALPVRVAFGALLIKAYLNLSDRETVESIQENVYLQYFLGYREFVEQAPFDATMMVHFRKRFSFSLIESIQDGIERKLSRRSEDSSPDSDEGSPSLSKGEENHGKLIIDATVAPADIRYPRDVDILNEAREKSERIIDELHMTLKGKERKVRTYRCIARQSYLSVAKQKRPSVSVVRKGVRSQLGYLRRNLDHISNLVDKVGLSRLSRSHHRELLIITEVFRQQEDMWKRGEHRVADRIVSCSQPHVRPIVRGKASAATEFGAKLSVSLVNGIARVDHLSWDHFNESTDLVSQVESYRKRYGCYPASVHADKVYRTRANRRYLKALGIRLSGPPLGRRPSIVDLMERRVQRQDERDRIAIEGKFGQGKRRFSLDRILAKLPGTSASWIGMVFFVMNLTAWLERAFLCFGLGHLSSAVRWFISRFGRTQDSIELVQTLRAAA